MIITIGDTIKKLRQNKGVTQEKFAETLNISTQAISKWERNECYPDITMLIPIASYFGVTVDELLGVDHAKNEIKINEYIELRRKYLSVGEKQKHQELTRKMYADFPNDFRVMNNYVSDLIYDINAENGYGYKIHRDEIIRLSNRILEECFDDDIRYAAIFNLKLVYAEDGNIERALQICERFPSTFYTKDYMKASVFNKGDSERLKYIRNHITELVYDLSIELRNIALEDSSLSIDDQITALQKGIDFINLIYCDNDHGFHNYLLSELYIWIGNRYTNKIHLEKAIEYYRNGFNQAIFYDNVFGKEIVQTSIFVKGHIYDMKNVCCDYESNFIQLQLENVKEFITNSEFKDNQKLISLLDEYKPYAKNYKNK